MKQKTKWYSDKKTKLKLLRKLVKDAENGTYQYITVGSIINDLKKEINETKE